MAVFTLTGLGLKRVTTAPATCTDGIKNGEEEGIDCGLFACGKECEPELKPPQVVSTKLIKTNGQGYDFVAELLNSNQDYGASEVSYELTLTDQAGEEILKRGGVFYILPGQTKFLILPFLVGDDNVKDIDFQIKSAKWQRIKSLEGMNLIVRREKYNVYEGGSSSALEAVIFNDSDFDFEVVGVDVILRNYNGDIVAVNRSEIRTFKARTERSFSSQWPFPITGQVVETEILPSTNLFDNSNFIKQFGSEIEQFQQY